VLDARKPLIDQLVALGAVTPVNRRFVESYQLPRIGRIHELIRKHAPAPLPLRVLNIGLLDGLVPYCASHSGYFWGLRLHTLMAPDGTPRAMTLTSPKASEREVCLGLLARVNRHGPVTVIGDKGYAGRDFQRQAADLEALIVRPRRKDEPGRGLHLAPIRQRIESIYWTAKDILTLERHGARTLRGLRARIASRFLALAAAIALNHQLGRPPRALADYIA